MEELPGQALQMPRPLLVRKMKTQAKSAVWILLASSVDSQEEAAHLTVEDRLEQPSPELLDRGRRVAGIRDDKMPCGPCRSLFRKKAADSKLEREGERGAGALLAEAGMDLEPLLAVRREAEVEVFVDQEDASSVAVSVGEDGGLLEWWDTPREDLLRTREEVGALAASHPFG